MNIGKKILSALIELPEAERHHTTPATNVNTQPVIVPDEQEKFRRHFERLLDDAQQPGPDYHAFVRMTAAMRVLTDEGARYQAAFAGLQAQGLDKQRLLDSARQCLALLEDDARSFQQSLNATSAEKIQAREAELHQARERMVALDEEMARLQTQAGELETEIAASSIKLENARAAYSSALAETQARVRTDLEKIEQHIS